MSKSTSESSCATLAILILSWRARTRQKSTKSGGDDEEGSRTDWVRAGLVTRLVSVLSWTHAQASAAGRTPRSPGYRWSLSQVAIGYALRSLLVALLVVGLAHRQLGWSGKGVGRRGKKEERRKEKKKGKNGGRKREREKEKNIQGLLGFLGFKTRIYSVFDFS